MRPSWEGATSRMSFGNRPGRVSRNTGANGRTTWLRSATFPRRPSREDRQQKMGATFVYRVHTAPDAASAKAFLEKNPVPAKLFYLIVETPEGNYCRDVNGIYKE